MSAVEHDGLTDLERQVARLVAWLRLGPVDKQRRMPGRRCLWARLVAAGQLSGRWLELSRTQTWLHGAALARLDSRRV
jgi:hypothetical protein